MTDYRQLDTCLSELKTINVAVCAAAADDDENEDEIECKFLLLVTINDDLSSSISFDSPLLLLD